MTCRKIFLFVLLALFSSVAFAEIHRGTFEILWGDGPDGSKVKTVRYILAKESGERLALEVPAHFISLLGGEMELLNRQVEVTFASEAASKNGRRVVASLVIVGEDRSLGGAVSGPQPWVSIMCRFSDKPSEPQDELFFDNMYGNAPGRLNHYWKELSYNIINVDGSDAYDAGAGWFVLPGTQVSYCPTPGSGTTANLNALFNDCTALADPIVVFTDFVGINLMFNDLLDCCAWGGSRSATFNDGSGTWRTTWEPPWGWAHEGVMGHEMGHGFGLPHSNGADDDGYPYDSPWSVMSDAHGYTVDDPIYGRLGKHTNAYEKNRLVWLAPGEIFEVPVSGSHTVDIDPLGLAVTANYRMIKINLTGGSYYTVETREKVGNYEADLPGTVVILNHVVNGRSEPAWIVDKDVPPADYADTEGVMWRMGETFVDPANGLTVSVDSMTATGFTVTVNWTGSDPVFSDGFESGNTSAWSVTQN